MKTHIYFVVLGASASPITSLGQGRSDYSSVAGWSSATQATAIVEAPIGQDYLVGRDPTVTYNGHPTGTIRATSNNPAQYQELAQTIRANAYRGKRIRLRGLVKTKEVPQGAGLWMRIDSMERPEAMDTIEDRAVNGTNDWKPYQVVLDVPPDAVTIMFGSALAGPGQCWASELTLEVVDPKKVSTTAGPIGPDYRQDPAIPKNMDFSVPPRLPSKLDVPSWRTSSETWNEVHRDPNVTRNGKPTVVIHDEQTGYSDVSLFQEILARPYRGKRVQLQAYIKASSDIPGGPSIAVPGGGQWVVGRMPKFIERGTKWVPDNREWKPVSAVIDVPNWANCLQIGVQLNGPGKMWVSEPSFKVVPKSTPLTEAAPRNIHTPDELRAIPTSPTNLNFAR